jgi:hypothetical protein
MEVEIWILLLRYFEQPVLNRIGYIRWAENPGRVARQNFRQLDTRGSRFR